MKLLVKERIDPMEWNSEVLELDGTVFHTSEWARFKSGDGIPLYFQLLDEDMELAGIALGIKHKSRFRVISWVTAMLHLTTIPVVRDNNANLLQQAINEIINFAKKQRFVFLNMDSFYATIYPESLEDMGFQTKPRIEFLIDLKKTEKELWEGLKSSHRRKIRRGMKNNLALVEENTIEGLNKLRKLQFESRERARKRGQDYDVGAEKGYERIKACLIDGGIAKIFCAKKEGEIVSSALIGIYNKKAFYISGGTNSTGYRSSAPSFLFWNVMTSLKRLGFQELNFGGVPKGAKSEASLSHGLYRFKDGFGGKLIDCVGGELILNYPTYKTLEVLTSIRKRIKL